VMPVGSEIVGLVPKRAIEMAADYFLQFENFSPAQIFENKLESALSGAPLESRDGKLAGVGRPFLDAVAAATPTPGGGSVSAYVGAMAAALGQMVAGLSRKKKSQALHVDKLSEMLEELRKTAEELTAAVDQDAASYEAVMVAFKLPQRSAEETAQRDSAIQAATKGAAEVPLQVAGKAAQLQSRLAQLETIAAASMKSDLQVARLMAVAAAKGALANVEINLEGLKDTSYVGKMKAQVAELRTQLG
jgi:glutamate formiminotransferase / formiminotetrahydrofolate cyclodeaminase